MRAWAQSDAHGFVPENHRSYDQPSWSGFPSLTVSVHEVAWSCSFGERSAKLDGIARGTSEFAGAAFPDDEVLADEDDDEDMGERQPRTPGTLHRDSSESLTVEQKKKIELLHCNMGHLSRDQMLLTLRAANAKEGVLKYVRDRFQCSSCMRQRKPVERRLAAVPRTFAFNRIVVWTIFSSPSPTAPMLS